jgi:hypothetical protein
MATDQISVSMKVTGARAVVALQKAETAVRESRRITKRKAWKSVKYKGLPLRIDRPRGFVQRGQTDTGKEWSRTYKYDYGFIANTEGGDGDGLDVFVGPHPDQPLVHWIVQIKADGSFDEYKCMLGFSTKKAAVQAYLQHVPKRFYAGATTTTVAMLKAALGLAPEERIPHPIAKSLIEQDELEKVRVARMLNGDPRALVDADVSGAIERMFAARETHQERLAKAVAASTRADAMNALAEAYSAGAAAGEAVKRWDVPICKKDEAKRLIYGVVLEPDVVDAQRDTYDSEAVEETAHLYVAHFLSLIHISEPTRPCH